MIQYKAKRCDAQSVAGETSRLKLCRRADVTGERHPFPKRPHLLPNRVARGRAVRLPESAHLAWTTPLVTETDTVHILVLVLLLDILPTDPTTTYREFD